MNEEQLINSVKERAHARFNFSSMAQIVNCPISKYLDKNLPDKPPSSYAQEGTKAHKLAEMYVDDIMDGKSFRAVDLNEYPLDMQMNCQGYANRCYASVEPYLNFPHAFFLERKIIGDLRRDIWGSADFIFIYVDGKDAHAIIRDYKNGVGVPVTHDINWQMIGYGWASLKDFVGKKKIDTVLTEIDQPRIDVEIPSKLYTREELLEYGQNIIRAVDLVLYWEKNGGPTKKDYKECQQEGYWCRWCKVNECGVCELKNGPKKRKIQSTFEKVAKEGLSNKINKDTVISHGIFSDIDLGFFVNNQKPLIDMVNGACEAAYALTMKGKKIPGTKLIEDLPRRSYIDDEETLIAGLKELGVDQPVIKEVKTKIIALTQVEKLFGEGSVDHLLKDRSLNKKYKLVSEDHESPEVTLGLSIESMFKDAIKNK